MQYVDVPPLEPERFEEVLDPGKFARFQQAMARTRDLLNGRRVWHINSTTKGGGVAEMLKPLLGYQRGAGWDAGWLVIDGDDEFFRVTKRIHNHLHADAADGERLAQEERRAYERALEREVDEIGQKIDERDIVFLQDPQTLGLAPILKQAGVTVVWTCHVGIDTPNDVARRAWDFLRGDLRDVDAYVFSRRSYVWDGLDERRVSVIAPAIDPFSPKNQSLGADASRDILRAAGILDEGPADGPCFEREDGSEGRITERADVVQDRSLPSSGPVVLQVSRWDKLKDHAGVLRGFAEHVSSRLDAHLVLAGPRADGVSDDPEMSEVLAEILETRDALQTSARERTHVARLPMDDLEASDAIVNGLQRRADVIVQKSLAEGFGLTVSEGMWKGRPVVASGVGGIKDQIVHEQTGLLIDDPSALDELGEAVTRLLEDAGTRERLGRQAHERVRDHFLLTRYLVQTADLLEDVSTNGHRVSGRT
jgi:trehalose synthase